MLGMWFKGLLPLFHTLQVFGTQLNIQDMFASSVMKSLFEWKSKHGFECSYMSFTHLYHRIILNVCMQIKCILQQVPFLGGLVGTFHFWYKLHYHLHNALFICISYHANETSHFVIGFKLKRHDRWSKCLGKFVGFILINIYVNYTFLMKFVFFLLFLIQLSMPGTNYISVAIQYMHCEERESECACILEVLVTGHMKYPSLPFRDTIIIHNVKFQ